MPCVRAKIRYTASQYDYTTTTITEQYDGSTTAIYEQSHDDNLVVRVLGVSLFEADSVPFADHERHRRAKAGAIVLN